MVTSGPLSRRLTHRTVQESSGENLQSSSNHERCKEGRTYVASNANPQECSIATNHGVIHGTGLDRVNSRWALME